MSAEPLESLPAHLRELIALESEAHPVDDALRAEVLARVELAIQLAGPGGSGGTAPRLGAGAGGAAGAAAAGVKKLLAVGLAAGMGGLLIGAGTGVVGSNLLRAPAPVRPPAPAVTAESDVPSPRDVPSAPSLLPDAPSAPSAAPPRAPHVPSEATRQSASSEEPSLRGDLTKERELLDVARAALARSRPGDAIAACELHAKTWPHGYLSEEREVVLIQALVAAGRRPEAERRAAQFRKTFRQSMLLPAVETALDGGP